MVVCGLVFEFLSKFFNFLQKGLALFSQKNTVENKIII
jgi:hypothetical protein